MLLIRAVNLNDRSIKQWTSLLVETKNRKSAITYLLSIPELLQTVENWDNEIRKAISNNSYWFAPLSPETGLFDPEYIETGKHRNQRARKDLREWLKKVGLPYHSPHKFRHGHAVYAIKNAKDVGDLKAVSQNLMHSNLSITDGTYGGLSKEDISKRIAGIGSQISSTNKSTNEIAELLINLGNQLKNNPS